MDKKALISILNYNGTEDTIECIKSICQYESMNDYLIVIWDNASQIDKYNLLEKYIRTNCPNSQILSEYEYVSSNVKETTQFVLVKSNENYGFAIANNKVLRPFVGDFDYYILLNNDTEFYQQTTKLCLDYLDDHKDIGVLTTAIYYYYDKNKIWNAGGKFISGWRRYYTESYVKNIVNSGVNLIDVDYITGCYMIIRNEIVEKYGLLSERFFFGEEDYNYCMRMKENQVRLSVRLDLGLWHKVGATTSRDANKDKSIRYAFIHYLNRMIDMKDFYSRARWSIWCVISSPIFFRLAFRLTDHSASRSLNFVKQLFKYCGRDNVDKDFFFRTMGGMIKL